MEVQLPHLAPIKFAKQILFQDSTRARVTVEFEDIPSLPMLIESAAQSSSALSSPSSVSNGYLVGMKNIKLHCNPTKKILQVEVISTHTLGNMKIVDFKVFEDEDIIADGLLTIAIESKEANE